MANHNPQTPAQALAGKRNYQKRQMLGAIANLYTVLNTIKHLELEQAALIHTELSGLIDGLDQLVTRYHLACKQATISRE